MRAVHHAGLERKVKAPEVEGVSFHMASGTDLGSTSSYRSLATISDVLLDVAAPSMIVDARRGTSPDLTAAQVFWMPMPNTPNRSM